MLPSFLPPSNPSQPPHAMQRLSLQSRLPLLNACLPACLPPANQYNFRPQHRQVRRRRRRGQQQANRFEASFRTYLLKIVIDHGSGREREAECRFRDYFLEVTTGSLQLEEGQWNLQEHHSRTILGPARFPSVYGLIMADCGGAKDRPLPCLLDHHRRFITTIAETGPTHYSPYSLAPSLPPRSPAQRMFCSVCL